MFFFFDAKQAREKKWKRRKVRNRARSKNGKIHVFFIVKQAQKQFEACNVDSQGDDKLRDYSIQERFWEGEYIKHRKYGIGIVTEMLDVNKMAVWFEDKKRIMVFNK